MYSYLVTFSGNNATFSIETPVVLLKIILRMIR